MAKDKPQPTQPDPVTPNPDAAILQGGPGQDAPVEEKKEPATPTGVEMTIAGQKYTLDPAVASALEERERQFERKMGQQGAELGELRRLKQQVDALNQAQAAQAQPNLDTLLFENPTKALELHRQQIVSELTQKYEQEKRQQEFWRDFKSRHKDLEGDDLVIHAVAAKNVASLNTITDPVEMADKIADLSRREILRIANRAKSDAPDKTRAVVEGKSIEAPKPTPRPEIEEKGSLSQTIRDRRKARHGAALSKGGK